MSLNLHFGYRPNQHTCSCGRHHGYGTLTAQERYDRAKDMQRRLPSYMPESMRAYLKDWELYHVTKPAFIPQPKPYQAYKD